MKRILSLLLGIIMVLSMIPVIGITASAATVPALETDADGAYLINSMEDWLKFTAYTYDKSNGTQVGSSTTSYYFCKGMKFKLTTDLDFTGVITDTDTMCDAMVGRYYGNSTFYFFSGEFDGQGHTISNFNVSLGRNVGLFTAAAGATIKNLNVVNSSFTCTNTDGKFSAGSIVAAGAGSGGSTGAETKIINCNVDDTVTVTGIRAGGIFGQAVNNNSSLGRFTLTVKDCYSAATVSNGTYQGGNVSIGGLVGMISTGDRYMSMSMENCTAVGAITAVGVSGNTYTIGGVAGALAFNQYTDDYSPIIKNCYADVKINVSGTMDDKTSAGIGGLCGTATFSTKGKTSVTVDNCYVVANITGSVAAPTGVIIGEHAANNSVAVTIKDSSYVGCDGVTAIVGKEGTTACVNSNTTTAVEAPAFPKVEGTLVLDETKVGLRYYISDLAEGTQLYLNGQAVESDEKGAVTDVVDVKDCGRSSILTAVTAADGTTCKKVIFYGVEKYAELQKDDAEAKAVAEALMNYGKYMNAYVNNVTLEDISVEMEAESTPASADPEGLTYNGSSLLIDSAVTLRHYYMLDEGKSISDYALTVGGEALTWDEKTITFGEEALTLYYVEFEVGATDFGTQFDVMLGDAVILRHSVMDYCMKAAESDKATAPVVNAVKALYNYRWAANDYFLSRSNEA